MIKYLENNRTFNLESKDSSYIFHISEAGYLIHDYYGKKIEGDLLYLNIVSEMGGLKRDQFDFDTTFNNTLSEVSSASRGDYRNPSIVIERCDGAIFSRFKYVSHRIYKGCFKLSNQPCLRSAKETLEVTLKDDFSNAVIKLNYSVYDDLV